MAINPIIKKILLDVLVFIAVIAGFVILRLVVKHPYRRGYFAEDLTIRLPYKPSTVSFRTLTIVALAINILTILATECCLDKRDSVIAKYYILKFAIPTWVWKSYIVIGIFGFGVACQQLTVDVAKLAIGRLRPHFYDTCQPVPDSDNSTSYSTYDYITKYKCSKSDLKESRLSFPSGHSCFAMYAAIFIILYVQSKMTWNGSKLLRHGFQLTVLTMAWYVCLSRVSDHMHHWDDVAAGIVLGVVSGVLVFKYILLSEEQKPMTNSSRTSFNDRYHVYKLGRTPDNIY